MKRLMHVCADINNFIILIQLKFGPAQLPLPHRLFYFLLSRPQV